MKHHPDVEVLLGPVLTDYTNHMVSECMERIQDRWGVTLSDSTAGVIRESVEHTVRGVIADVAVHLGRQEAARNDH